jgi:hypothetical protein
MPVLVPIGKNSKDGFVSIAEVKGVLICRGIAVRRRDWTGTVMLMAALAAYRHLLRSARIAFHGMASSQSGFSHLKKYR